MRRSVQPELLDEMPPEDPRARASREDLRWVNKAMGHAAMISEWLLDIHQNRGRLSQLCELGAGDGHTLLKALERLPPSARPLEIVLVDRMDLVSASTREQFVGLGNRYSAVCAPAEEWLRTAGTRQNRAIIANLFLHHFSTDALRRLLHGISEHAQYFAAWDPRRSRIGLVACRLMRLAGCHRVTIHDGLISIRAGFRGHEIAALWPESGWRISESDAGPFSHHFKAVKVA